MICRMRSKVRRFLWPLVILGCLSVTFTVLKSSDFTQFLSGRSSATLIKKTTTLAKTHLRVKERPSFSSKSTTTTTPVSTLMTNLFDGQREETFASHKFNQSEVAARFEKRRETLQTACRLHSNSSAFRKLRVRTVPWPQHRTTNLSVTYCPIQKVSSTTWKGIFKAIRKKSKIHRDVKLKRGVSKILPGRKNVLFVFVREPYGRLLSAYVDKLFSPNTLFWKKTGRYIIQKFRRNASRTSRMCGHDVTFAEYVKFFIHMQKTGQKRDGHFIPTHDHCHMCEVPYQYIGHLETLSEDMPFILNAMQSPVTYNKEFHNATIMGNANMVLKRMRSKIQNCLDLDEACRRLWKKWQVRGIISKTQSFPLTKIQTRDISLTNFQKVGLAAVARSGDKSTKAEQKKEALREAFASISLEDRREVQKLLFLDFQLFGFNPQPEEVFPQTAYKSEPNFSYFDLYK